MKTPAERIAKRRADMPKAYRKNYDRAMSGQSRRAAMHAFCLECCQWERVEVRICTSYACPLYPYRPYTDAQDAPDGQDIGAESSISENSGNDSPQAEMTSQNEKY